MRARVAVAFARSRVALAVLLLGCSSSDRLPSSGLDASTPPDARVPGSDGATVETDAAADAPAMMPGLDAGLGAPVLDAEAPSHGGTITFETIGAAGSYPSRRDPDAGPCDAYQSSSCCLATDTITSNALTPWDEDLIMTLRGPMQVAQLAVYQPSAAAGSPWNLVSSWQQRTSASPQGMAFDGNGTEKSGFAGAIGTECLVNVSTSQLFACGPGSVPYCPVPAAGHHAYKGWAGSKLFVILVTMPHAPDVPGPCSTTTTGGWYDAPWIGLSVGELVRAGAFSGCQCYAKDPTQGSLANGCGQFNAFEVVNDNNQYKNLDVFSTDMIDYAGYVGEGPCGPKCAVTSLSDEVDLIDKKTDTESVQGAVSTPTQGPGAAFRRNETSARYFLMLLDVPSRTVQLAMVSPASVPAAIAALLPGLPATVDSTTVDAVRALRLPK